LKGFCSPTARKRQARRKFCKKLINNRQEEFFAKFGLLSCLLRSSQTSCLRFSPNCPRNSGGAIRLRGLRTQRWGKRGGEKEGNFLNTFPFQRFLFASMGSITSFAAHRFCYALRWLLAAASFSLRFLLCAWLALALILLALAGWAWLALRSAGRIASL